MSQLRFSPPSPSDRWFILTIFLFCSIPLTLIGVFPNLFYREFAIESFLIFHNVTEIFSIIVSFSIFGLGFFSYSQSRNAHTFFLGIGFLVIGLVDFMHTLGYRGMPDFITPNSGNKSTQFWIVSRFITAIVLLSAVFISPQQKMRFVKEKLSIFLALLLSLLVFVMVLFYPEHLPTTYEQGKGLTAFKKISEFLIMSILFVSLFFYRNASIYTSQSQLIYYYSAFIVCIFSELVFAVYTSVFDVYNVIGHVYKVLAFYLIYKAVFISAIHDPYDRLILANQLLTKKNKENEDYAALIQKSLREKENLIGEIFHRTKNSMELVRSLLMIQAAEHEDDENIQAIVQDTSMKIKTMVLVHDHLFKNKDLSEIKVSDYLISLSEMVQSVYRHNELDVKLHFQIDGTSLLLDTAVPLGLIFTEILSNTLKYAFPKTKSGDVYIQYSSENTMSHLVYRDNGIGLPKQFDLESQKKLGLSLSKIIAEKQMGGKLQFQGTQGFEMIFDFPNNLYQRRI